MELKELQPGDIIYASQPINNDGSVPDIAEGQLLAEVGTRGVLINTGHLEEEPKQELYLVRFENNAGELGPPIGCWPEELSAEPPLQS